MTSDEYVTLILSNLATNDIIASFEIVEQWVVWDRGYICVRASLTNADFIELAEYFVVIDGEPITDRYRYQWMDGKQQQLRCRWDNVEHFPELPGFPHHVHSFDGR